jgi:predicted transcriptional regulator
VKLHVDYMNIAEYTGLYVRNLRYASFRVQEGDEIVTTDQEILVRLEEIEKRMEKIETTLESINNILKKVEQNTYFGCYVEGEKLE